MTKNSQDMNEFIAAQRNSEATKGLPLQGKRVIDISTVIAGPYASALLGDAGAEVIKVENPAVPDALRGWGTIGETGIEPYHAVIGRNKLPVTLNLKSEEGVRLFLELIRQADVLIENVRVGVMTRLGISHDTLLEVNPGLVIGKISGYGMDGPHAKQPGFGTLAEAYSGYTYLNGHPEGAPTSPPIALADMTAGVHLAYAVSLALIGAERGSHGGKVVDVSLYEPLFAYHGGEFVSYDQTGAVPEPIGNELRAAAPRNNYETADGKWIALSCSSQKPWEALAKVMGQNQLISDPRFLTNNDRIRPENRQVLNEIIQVWMRTKTEEEALALFRREGITAGPIMSMADIAKDEHYQERGSIAEVQDPASGRDLKMPNVPFRIKGQDNAGIRFPGLPHGAANEAVFGSLLGLSHSDLDALSEARIV